MSKITFRIGGNPTDLSRGPSNSEAKVMGLLQGLKLGDLITTRELSEASSVSTRVLERLDLNRVKVRIGSKNYFGNSATIKAARRRLNEV
jgi:hypothetical protein